MNDLGGLMKQAQAMQEKLQAAQQRLSELRVEGTSGGGVVTVTLTGAGELVALAIDDTLLKPGEGEILADLVIAAHADAKRKLEARQAEMMREIAGPFAGLAGLTGL